MSLDAEVEELALEVGQLRIRVSRREAYGTSPLRVSAVSTTSSPSQLPSSGALAGPRATEPEAQEDLTSLRSWSEVGRAQRAPSPVGPWTQDWFEALAAADSPSALKELDLSPISHLISRLRTTSAGSDPEARLARALRAGILARHWLDNRPLASANIGGPTLPSKFFIVLKAGPGLSPGWTGDYTTYLAQVILLFRRPAFSVLDKVYQEGVQFHADLVFHMSKQCRAELMSLCLIAPTLQTDMRATTAPELYMLDASPFGGGICRAAMPSSVVEEFWRHSEQRGYYTKLQQGAGLALREIGLERCEFFGEPEVRPFDQDIIFTSELAPPLHDSTIAYDCIELFAGVGNMEQVTRSQGLESSSRH